MTVSRQFIFVGVSTRESSMMRIFPRWRVSLGLPPDIELVGRDFPLHAPPSQYRELAARIKTDPAIVGGLVTSHKIDLYSAAENLFDEVDGYARLLGEVSCIAHRGDRLLGWAKDPIAAGRALGSILGSHPHEPRIREVLCFGAGGAGHAITLHILTAMPIEDRPHRMIVVEPDPERLERLQALHERLHGGIPIEYIGTGDPARGDEIVAALADNSLVINATGMGKDRPGSPVTDDVLFPCGGIAWELNYRGELRFLHQAWKQRDERELTVEDGWEYFILGWATVLEEVFERPIDEGDLARLDAEAVFARPSLPTWDTSGKTESG